MKKLTTKYLKCEPTINNIVTLINLWECDRGAESVEYVYDLQCAEDFKNLIDMYSIGGAISAYNINDSYWWGGGNFPYDDDYMMALMQNPNKVCDKCVFHPFMFDEITIDWILGKIEDRIEYYASTGISLNEMASYYHDMIDIKAYLADYDTIHNIKKFYSSKVSAVDIDDIHNVELNECDGEWELWYLEFGDDESDVILRNTNFGTLYYIADTECYPYSLDNAKVYRWTDDEGRYYSFDSDFVFSSNRDIVYKRLVKLNGATIDNETIDGIVKYSVNDERESYSLKFVNYTTNNVFIAHYTTCADIKPYMITKETEFTLR